MSEKTFNLTWNNHLANLSGLFEGLYKSGFLTDTTLACQGGMLRAHRLVLAACSPYFESVFKEHYGEQPILILKGVAVEEMECLLDFMYRGSIDVAEEHLPSLIKTATDLEIRGLSGDQRNQEINRAPYTRVDSRRQRCHIETRVHTTEYLKESSIIPFLPKQSSIASDDQIKAEEIEVEDDPMVIDGHDDVLDEPLRPIEEQIRHVPPPMYKRETRYKGQKRVAVGRLTRNSEPVELRSRDGASSLREEAIKEITLQDTPSADFKEDLAASVNNGSAALTDCPKPSGEETAPRVGTKRKLESLRQPNVNEGREQRDLPKPDKSQYKPFSCDLCTLAFTRASHLARHRRVHTGERPFACNICPRMFARQDKLKQHLDSHLTWSRRRSGLSSHSSQSTRSNASTTTAAPTKGKRGRPRKVQPTQPAMERIMELSELNTLLNKPVSSSETSKKNNNSSSQADSKVKAEKEQEEEEVTRKEKDNCGCQVENGKDIV